jgi:serine/threonine-protein kinase Chk2
MSSNGTFVNGHKIGKGKSRILEHNATISMTHPNQRQYVYMSSSQDYSRDYPLALNKKFIVSRDLGSGVCGIVR